MTVDFVDGRGKDARNRVKFKLHDKQAALVTLGRLLGLFDPKKREPEKVEVDVEELRATILAKFARIAEAQRAQGGDPGDEPRTTTEVPTSAELVEREAAAAGPKAEDAPGSLEDETLHPDWTPQKD